MRERDILPVICSCHLSTFDFVDTGAGPLYEAARSRRLQAHRPGTRKNFATYHRLFVQFCLVTGIPVLDPSVHDLAAFAEFLVQAGLAPSTIQNYLSAIKSLYLSWELPAVISAFNSYAWSLTVKAISLSVRPPLDSRTAVTLPHLQALVCCVHP